jgi:predicted dehydrogenase
VPDPVRIGLVGLGQRGLQHLRSLAQLADAKVVALCDPFPDNLKQDKIRRFVDGFDLEPVHTYTAFDEMFAAGGLDAIYFSIPPALHAGEVVRCAEAGIHLFVEKPVSLFLDEADQMRQAIEASGIIACAGFNQRHDLWHTTVRDFLADKHLQMMTFVVNGTLESHSTKHTHTESMGGPANRVWTANMAWSGATVVEAGIHQTDLMRYWAGDIAWTEARYLHRTAQDIEDAGDNPYAYSVTYGFESGMIANLLMSRLRRTFYSDSYQDIMWDRGHLKLEGDGPAAYYYDGPYPPEEPVDPQSLRHLLTQEPRGDATFEISRAFVAAVASGERSHLRNTFSSSMNSHCAVLAANISDRLGGERVDLKALMSQDRYAEFRRKPANP